MCLARKCPDAFVSWNEKIALFDRDFVLGKVTQFNLRACSSTGILIYVRFRELFGLPLGFLVGSGASPSRP